MLRCPVIWMFLDFTQVLENSFNSPRPPPAILSKFTNHTGIYTTQSELMRALLNKQRTYSRRLYRLVLVSVLCPAHTITAVCNTTGDINNTSTEWRPNARSGETKSSSLQNNYFFKFNTTFSNQRNLYYYLYELMR
jgi:hypothetical protein